MRNLNIPSCWDWLMTNMPFAWWRRAISYIDVHTFHLQLHANSSGWKVKAQHEADMVRFSEIINWYCSYCHRGTYKVLRAEMFVLTAYVSHLIDLLQQSIVLNQRKFSWEHCMNLWSAVSKFGRPEFVRLVESSVVNFVSVNDMNYTGKQTFKSHNSWEHAFGPCNAVLWV
jgi:hypothetical protein